MSDCDASGHWHGVAWPQALGLGLISLGGGAQCHGLRGLGLRSGFESPHLDRPGRQLHQQGLCEASLRLGYRDGSPPKRAPGPESSE